MAPRALWTNGQYWGSPVQLGAHHYARQLLQRSWDVAFVSDPISPWHLLYPSTARESLDRYHTWRRGGRYTHHRRLFDYTPLTLLPPFNAPLLRHPWVLKHWQQFTLPNLRKTLARHGFHRVDLLVVDSIAQGFWLDVVDARKTLTRVADNLAGFAATTPAMLERERDIIRQVDLVAYTAQSLKPLVTAHSPKASVYVPNGVDIAHFTHDRETLPEEYRHIPKPRAIYVGAIQAWFDTQLLTQVAQRLNRVSFVLIGPPRTDLGSLTRLGNVHLLGRRSYAAIPPYLKHAHVGLIPFKPSPLVRSVNPLKLYEYMACGLPVVATGWEELRRISSPSVLCDTTDQWVNAIEQALANPPDHDRLRRFAQTADWSQRFKILANALGIEA